MASLPQLETTNINTVPKLVRYLVCVLTCCDGAQNNDVAKRLHTLANDGCPVAQYELGTLLYEHGIDMKSDKVKEKAIEWLTKAADHNSDAYIYLAMTYLQVANRRTMR